jgi:hypothetical protein
MFALVAQNRFLKHDVPGNVKDDNALGWPITRNGHTSRFCKSPKLSVHGSQGKRAAI